MRTVTTTAAKTRQRVLVLVPRDPEVVPAAPVEAPLTTGILQVSDAFTRAGARRIVKQITRTAG